MNKRDRVELDKAVTLIEEAKAIVESIGESEQEKFDNLSEGLQQSERGEGFQSAAEELSNVATSLEDAISSIQTASE
jgi:hypothetical protein